MDKKMVLLTCFLSILTLIFSVICSSFIYFNDKRQTDSNGTKVLASNNIYKKISIVYNEDNNINVSNLIPGASIEKKFSITNENSNSIKYNIEWFNISSTWNKSLNNFKSIPEEFVYSISCTDGEKIENKTMPFNNEKNIILENLELKTNKTNECIINIKFLNKEEDQSYNYNKEFKGTYKVVITK